MNQTTEKERINALVNRQGVFGLGFSNNNHLDLLNLLVLACAGLIIAIFFQEPASKNGTTGPATTNIWGYGLTSLALFLMIFMSFYLTNRDKLLEHQKKDESNDNKSFLEILLKLILNDSLPIVLTFMLMIYLIYINFVHFYRINSGFVTDSYNTYSFFSVLLIIIQIGLIFKYMYNLLKKLDGSLNDPNNKKQIALIKSISYILVTINFIFIMILHILLAFFSTDG